MEDKPTEMPEPMVLTQPVEHEDVPPIMSSSEPATPEAHTFALHSPLESTFEPRRNKASLLPLSSLHTGLTSRSAE